METRGIKRGRKIILLFISAVLVSIIVFGGETKAYAEETILPAYFDKNGNESLASTYQYQLNQAKRVIFVPVQISHAGLVMLEVSSDISGIEMAVVLSRKPTWDDRDAWISWGIGYPDQTLKVKSYAESACTWYLIFFISEDSVPDTNIVVKAYQKAIKAGNGTLKKGKWDSYYMEGNATALYKIKLPSSGMMKMELDIEDAGSEYYEIIAKLLDSKGKAVSDRSLNCQDRKVSYYGLKKGTYFLQVKNCRKRGEKPAECVIPLKNKACRTYRKIKRF